MGKTKKVVNRKLLGSSLVYDYLKCEFYLKKIINKCFFLNYPTFFLIENYIKFIILYNNHNIYM